MNPTSSTPSAGRIALILLCVLGISLAQVLLKVSAAHSARAATDPAWLGFFNRYLFIAVAMLGSSTLLWTWLLRSIPLNVGYPFMALAFVLVPTICWFAFGESLSPRQLAGSLLIVVGVVVVSM